MRQIALKRLGLGVLFGAMLTCLGGVSAWAANSVVVESKSVVAGTTGVTIGVFVSNDLAIMQCVVPLEFRSSVSNGAFITALKRSFPTGTRWDGKLTDIRIANQYENPDASNCATRNGGFRQGYGTILNADQDLFFPVSASPEGVLFVRGKIFSPSLPAGSDGATPSIVLTVDIGNAYGTFEIDTTCTLPANHLVFGKDTSVIPPIPVMSAFTKGVITVACPKGFSAAPSGPTPADGAQEQSLSSILRWNPVFDSCGVPASSYDVLLGSNCSGLDPVLACAGTDADTCTVSGLDTSTVYFWKVIPKDFMGRQTTGTIPCWRFKTTNISAVQYLGGDGIPRDYSLDQNYPNPFNASTVIRFNIKHDGHVRLDVFNILGQKVKTLVDEFRQLGPQAADWDGTDLVGRTVPTGLYFYRLVTSDYTDIKKMVLLK